MHRLLNTFRAITGYPVLINTSFNVKGEPIVCSPVDAVNSFLNSDIDFLIMNDIIVGKSEFSL